MAPISAQFSQIISLITRDTSTPPASSLPQAPTAALPRGRPSTDGWTPSSIIAIVAAIAVVLSLVPLIAIVLRRYERKRCLEMLPEAGLQSSKSSVREDQSLKSILVTMEVQRSSLRVVARPEEVYVNGQGTGWSRTEVRGGSC
jgi:hypothetical protein